MRLFKRKNQNEEDASARRRIRVESTPVMRPSSTFSYYAKRSEDEANVGRDVDNSYNKEQKSDSMFRKIVRRSLAVVVLLVIIAFLINSLTLSPDPKVVALTTPNNEIFLGDSAAYQKAAAKLFNSIGNRNKLTINTNEISNSMLNQFPELAAVSVTLPVAGHTPTVFVQPSDPSMILNLQSGDSYVLDNHGKALVSASMEPNKIAKLQVPVVMMQNGANVKLGETVLPSTTISFINTVRQQLGAMHIAVSSMVIPSAASELDVYVAGQPFYGKFNTESGTAQQQSGTFIATYRHLLNSGKPPKQYIDVRIDGRAYYK